MIEKISNMGNEGMTQGKVKLEDYMEKVFVSTVESLCHHCKGYRVSIYGARSLAQRVYYILTQRGEDVDSFIVSSRYKNPSTLANGIPVLRIEEEQGCYDCMVLAVGKTVVEEVVKELLNYEIRKLVIVSTMIRSDFPQICMISTKSYISEKAWIGNNVQILADDSSEVIIEDDVTIKTGTQILAVDHSYIHINRGSAIDENGILEISDHSKMILHENVRIDEKCNFDLSNRSELEILSKSYIKDNAFINGENDSRICIENNVSIGKSTKIIAGPNARIKIGKGATFEGFLTMIASGSSINIGEDNMFSWYIKMVAGGHKVIDRQNGKDITNRKSIKTGKHVWGGIGATLFPGCDVGEGSVIGANAFVNKTIPAHSTCAQNTGKVLRENIDWKR